MNPNVKDKVVAMDNHTGCSTVATVVIANCLSLALAGHVRAQGLPADSRLDVLQQQVDAQNQRLDEMRDQLAAQEHSVAQLQRALDMERLAITRARGTADAVGQGLPVAMDTAAPATAALAASVAAHPASVAQDQVGPVDRAPATSAVAQADEPPDRPVGRAPEQDLRPPEVAQIFDQPGVLTPSGTFILEPSLQFGYSSSNRVALVGYTIIPAILIGLIDVRQVKTSTGTAALTGRMGIGNRFELEARVPYVYSSSDTVSREIFTGTAVENVFTSSGKGLGDIEATARMQLNRGGPDKPFYVGWLRYKSRTGKDPFEVVTDCVTRCVANATGTGLPLELPTGSGFASLQPGLTWLYPSDPVVFFGGVSYLHNFKRDGVSRTVLTGAPPEFPQTATEPIGEVEAGDIWGVNFGMGLALNEKASISIGYDTSFIGKTRQNGTDAPGAVRITLGTLLLGASYRYSDRYTLNVALGVGVTRDTPDMTLTARVPISF